MTARIVFRITVVALLVYSALTQKCPASGRSMFIFQANDTQKKRIFSIFCSLKILCFKWCFSYYNLSNWKHSHVKQFLRFLSSLVSLPTQCHERSKVLRKSSYSCKRRLVDLRCNVKRTRWSDYVSRADLSLSFLSSRKNKKRQKQKTIITLPMCWSFFIIWRSCTHSSERLQNALRIIEKRCNAF